MSVTKRTRFEVLRRDSHTCQYCGGKSPDVALHVDHVVPVALGGGDEPSNLVTACVDCNSGKSSTKPDGPLVEAVSAAAASFAIGLRDAVERRNDEIAADSEFYTDFLGLWESLVPGFRRSSWRVPDDARASVIRWHQMGVGLDTFDYAIRIALAKKDVVGMGKFSYMAGIVWNIVRQAETEQTHRAEPSDAPSDAYSAGWEAGSEAQCKTDVQYCMARHTGDDLLVAHVDGREMPAFALRVRRAS